jgi:type II secretory ATPase GspE/PulE/Tfp pilus assembly ATPase PilB-like protein
MKDLFSSHKAFPGWDAYCAGRNGALDPLVWLERTDPAAHGQVFSDLATKYKRAFTILSETSAQSSACMLYLEAMAGEGRELAEVIDSLGPVPIGLLGHIMVFIHCDPSAPIPPGFPSHLATLLWVTVDDFLRVREDFRDRARALRTGVVPRKLSDNRDPPPSKEQGLRKMLEWLMEQPTVDFPQRSAIEFLLSLPDSDLSLPRLQGDIQCSIAATWAPELPVIPAAMVKMDRTVLDKISNKNRCTDLGFVPYALNARSVLVAADNDSPKLADVLAQYFPGLRPIVARASMDGIRYLLNESNRSATGTQAAKGFVPATEEDLRKVLYSVDPSKFVGKNPRSFVNDVEQMILFLLADATAQRTSDIHMDIFYGMTRIRYAIDGGAQTMYSLPAEVGRRVATLLKDVACKKGEDSESPIAPQAGDFAFSYSGRRINCRVTMWPVNDDPESPRLDIRILDSASGVRDFALLGLFPEEQAVIRKHIRRRSGMIIISGPTGAGKSTTLMACIKDINSPKRIIYTLEDPVEYRIPGVSQFAVTSDEKEKIKGKKTFAEGIRILLRMNPHVIMVGEIRDLPTANAALAGANTGHNMFTTIHANSTVDILKRLIDIGVTRQSISECINLLTAQRLVKQLCACNRQVPVSEEIGILFDQKKIERPKWVCEPVGCSRCRRTGYSGRFLVVELLEINHEIADLISDGASSRQIREAAVNAPGYIPLFTSGLRRVANGQTSLAALLESIDPD